jgi:pimeloyl-ACP methyl ester carboxylesterase
MPEPQRISIPLEDGIVSALEWPGDGPLLHCAHANGFNAETYRGLLGPLAESFRIVASDARGHGFTRLPTHPGTAHGWRVYRDDLLAVLDRIAPDGAILAGHSMGATASLMAAALRPERVRALVLVEPVLVSWRAFLLMSLPWNRHRNTLALGALKRRAVFPSREMALAAYRGRGAFKTWPEETIRDYLKGGLVDDPAGVRLACAPAWEAEDFRSTPPGVAGLAARIRCPVTLIHAKDGTSAPAQVARFARLSPTARILAKDGATHFLPMEFPELVREEIVRAAAA